MCVASRSRTSTMLGLVANPLTLVASDGTRTVVVDFASLALGFRAVVSSTFCGSINSGVLLPSVLLLVMSILIMVVLLVVPIVVVIIVVAVMVGATGECLFTHYYMAKNRSNTTI
jgi:uncharacterized membrane protein